MCPRIDWLCCVEVLPLTDGMCPTAMSSHGLPSLFFRFPVASLGSDGFHFGVLAILVNLKSCVVLIWILLVINTVHFPMCVTFEEMPNSMTFSLLKVKLYV